MRQRQPVMVYFLLILPPLFWAGNSVLARGIAELIPPVALSFWRWLLALVILLPFTWRHVRRDLPMIRKNWPTIAILGLLGIASFNTLLYTAAHTTTVINMTLTQAIMPAIILIISFFMFGEKVTRLQVAAVAMCVGGTGYVIIQGDFGRLVQLEFVRGDLLMLLAVIFYAFYSVFLRKSPPIHPLSFLTSTFTVGVAVLFPLLLWEQQAGAPYQVTLPILSSLIYLATFPSILAYLYWNRGVREIGANRAGLYINLIPLFAALLAILLLGERFQSYHLIGTAAICTGLLLFNLPTRRTKDMP